MKLYIMTDVSKISGILWGGLGLPPWFNFPKSSIDKFRLPMTEIVNQTVKAARLAGISECVVHEASPLNLPSLEDVEVVRGGETLYLDNSFAGIVFVGQGLVKDIKSTTEVETNLQEIRWNDRRIDELTICALYAASLGIPTLMAHGDFSDIKTLLEWLPEIPVVKNIEKELPEHLAQLSTRSSPNLPEGEIKTSFKFRAYQLANFHSRLPGVSRIDDFTTETSSNNISGAFSDYSLSGLAVVADWINNTRIHASCRK